MAMWDPTRWPRTSGRGEVGGTESLGVGEVHSVEGGCGREGSEGGVGDTGAEGKIKAGGGAIANECSGEEVGAEHAEDAATA